MRRLALTSRHVDPPALVPVLEAMSATGIALADVLVDSGYSHRYPRTGHCRSDARLLHRPITPTPTTVDPRTFAGPISLERQPHAPRRRRPSHLRTAGPRAQC